MIPRKPDLPVGNYKGLSERLTNSCPRLLPGLNPSDPLGILKATSPAMLSPLLRYQEWGDAKRLHGCQVTSLWGPLGTGDAFSGVGGDDRQLHLAGVSPPGTCKPCWLAGSPYLGTRGEWDDV